MRSFMQHYGNPLHVCCRVRDFLMFFGIKKNMREIMNWKWFVNYDFTFRQLIY